MVRGSSSATRCRGFETHEEKEKIYFLNDAVISKGGFSRAIRIELKIDESFAQRYLNEGFSGGEKDMRLN